MILRLWFPIIACPIATFVIVFALMGCGGDVGQQSKIQSSAQNEVALVTVRTSRGMVECIIWDDYKQGGLSCDWEHPR